MFTAAHGIEIRSFIGRDEERYLELDALSVESRAALRQFSIQRLFAYGPTYADAMELRGRVAQGEDWSMAAMSIATNLLATLSDGSSKPSRTNVLYRASAMTRLAQVMMIQDTDERREIFRRASALYEEASIISADRERFSIKPSDGPILGWLHAARGERVGAVIIIGGLEGWAMDLTDIAQWHVERGIEVWAIDGPGQGESRLMHRHYLQTGWRETYGEVIAHIRRIRPGVPLGLCGMSMGATFALEIAARESDIVACCANGGTVSGQSVLGMHAGKVPKKRFMCGPDMNDQEIDAIWNDIELTKVVPKIKCPVLLIHGGLDPLIPEAETQAIFEALTGADKHLIVFNDGDHCIYNHGDDRSIAMADWMAAQLAAARRQC